MSLYLSMNKLLYIQALICAFKTELNIYINSLMDNSNHIIIDIVVLHTDFIV